MNKIIELATTKITLGDLAIGDFFRLSADTLFIKTNEYREDENGIFWRCTRVEDGEIVYLDTEAEANPYEVEIHIHKKVPSGEDD